MILKHLTIAAVLIGGLAATPALARHHDHHGWNDRHHRKHQVCRRERHHHRWVRRCHWR